ncbi:hypothetical protein CAEBREN_03070 [Caenorhabditis brenneri]|uniref:Uncharacterized protein n=1 Tax=Caenorhabditis brenneri TaxID=135651 RepID=G0NGI5_CAEBE|nr:hypothetical protein CAEBREN_03070 [Caenorhabditis brenneri]
MEADEDVVAMHGKKYYQLLTKPRNCRRELNECRNGSRTDREFLTPPACESFLPRHTINNRAQTKKDVIDINKLAESGENGEETLLKTTKYGA